MVPILTASFQGTDSVINKALARAKAPEAAPAKSCDLEIVGSRHCKELGMVKPGETVVAIHGQREECPGTLCRSCSQQGINGLFKLSLTPACPTLLKLAAVSRVSMSAACS